MNHRVFTPWKALLVIVNTHLSWGSDVSIAAQAAENDFAVMAASGFMQGDKEAPNYALLADMAHHLSCTRVENCEEFLSSLRWVKT